MLFNKHSSIIEYSFIIRAIVLVTLMGMAWTVMAQSFAPAGDYTTGAGPRGVAVGDFNMDGKLDIATANNDEDNMSVLLGNGDGTFNTPASSSAAGTNPNKIVAGDFNLDGKTDLALTNQNSNNVSVFIGNGNGTFITPAPVYAVGRNPQAIKTGDFNGDGIPDLITVNLSVHTLSILSGNGDGTFTTLAPINVPGASSGMIVADFNLDGLLDVVVVNYDVSGVSVLLCNGNGTFQPPFNYQIGPGPFSLAVGDFNQDGKTDLAVGDQSDGKVYVLLGNGDGSLITPGPSYLAGPTPLALTVSDFTLDGKQDLAAANTIANKVSLLVNQGGGMFAMVAPTFTVGQNPNAIASGDFNLDGKPDIVVTNGSTSNISILLNTAGPTVSLTSPPNGSHFSTGETINITATATASNGATIDHVDFYDGQNLMGSDATAPYSFQWNNASPGTHSIRAAATDNSGASSLSQTASVTVTDAAAVSSISGRVLDSNGGRLADVTIQLQSQQLNLLQSTQTDEKGFYQFTGLAQGYDYTLQPSLNGYSFTPTSRNINHLSADQMADFTATPVNCTYSLSSNSQHFSANAGSGFFNVTALQGCPWRVRISDSWIDSYSTEGDGNATVTYYVQANETHTPRSATINIGGQILNITQDAASESCQYQLTPSQTSFGAEGGQGSVQVSVTNGCEWRARSNDFWISITSGSGDRGSGVVTFTVGGNGGAAKTGTMTIAGQTVTIQQQGAASSPHRTRRADSISP